MLFKYEKIIPNMRDEYKKISWFNWYCEELEKGAIKAKDDGYLFTCPCCGFPTLSERGGFEICEICFWEDDGQDSHNADKVLAGPNSDYSLDESRKNFESHFTCYRPSDTSAFNQSKKRIEWAKSIYDQLLDYRWKGRVQENEIISKILKSAPS